MNHPSSREHFMRLVQPHIEPLFRLAWRLTGTRHDAEDLLQELLLKLYPRTDELARVEQLRPWLARVLYRMFIDEKRRSNRSPLHLAIDNSPDDNVPAALDEHRQTEEPPESGLQRSHDQQLVEACIRRLSGDHRDVLLLHDIEGYALKEMEAILDCPIGTLKSRLHRARARLRELLEEEGTFHFQ